MPALAAGIHVQRTRETTTWMAGSSPAMTDFGVPSLRGAQQRSNPAALWIAAPLTGLAMTTWMASRPPASWHVDMDGRIKSGHDGHW